jgi:hypothetical protein
MKKLFLFNLLFFISFFGFGAGPLTGTLVYFPGSGTLKPGGIHLYYNGFRLDSIYGSTQVNADWWANSGAAQILHKPTFLSPDDTCSDQDQGHGPIEHCAFVGKVLSTYRGDKRYLPISFSETDPLFVASPAYGVTSDEITLWNNNTFPGLGYDHTHAAYGDHSHRWLLDSINGSAGMVGKVKVDLPKFRIALTMSTIPHGGPPPPYIFHDSLIFQEEHSSGYPNLMRLLMTGASGSKAVIGSRSKPIDTINVNIIWPPISCPPDTSIDAVQHTLSGNNIFRYGGNVGIGTTTPAYQLDITKNFNLTNTTYTNQYGIILKGGNTFMHDFNYGNNGTVTTNGLNLFIGPNAGNFSMGSTAVHNYEASANVGIGFNALPSLTTGFGNVGVGANVLNINTTGYYNMAIGVNALDNNIDGSMNIGIGFQSLIGPTNGTRNIAIGAMALSIGSAQHDNIVIGSYGAPNINGNFNVSIGNYAIFNATGTDNTVIGTHIGPTLTSGNANILIGGSYNSGNLVDVPTGNTSNFLNIGNTIYGTAINEATAGKIGINTTTPSQKLEVNGNTAIDSALLLTTTQHTITGSTSGTVVWSMPFQGSSYKKVVVYFNAMNDAGTSITYPVAFVQTPYLNGVSSVIAVSSTSTTTLTIARTNGQTGFVFIEGW